MSEQSAYTTLFVSAVLLLLVGVGCILWSRALVQAHNQSQGAHPISKQQMINNARERERTHRQHMIRLATIRHQEKISKESRNRQGVYSQQAKDRVIRMCTHPKTYVIHKRFQGGDFRRVTYCQHCGKQISNV